MADHYITDLEEQNEILRKAVQGIARECDNTNETHETIWRIAYNALQECGLDMVDASENTLPIHIVRVSTWENASKGEQQPFIERAVELAQDTLFCTRVWSAWGYGTMTENDFVDATDEDDFINGIAKAIWEGY